MHVDNLQHATVIVSVVDATNQAFSKFAATPRNFEACAKYFDKELGKISTLGCEVTYQEHDENCTNESHRRQ